MATAEALDGRDASNSRQTRVSIAAIRNELASSRVVSLVGEVAVSHPQMRRDFYVEPLNPPRVPELTDRQVAALNAAAYFNRQATAELSAIPRQFADNYNRILREMLPLDRFLGWTVMFGFVSNLASARVELGRREYFLQEGTAQVTQGVDISVEDPELQAQLVRVQKQTHTASSAHPTEVYVRLFPPGLAKIVHDHEKGYYVDGNVKERRGLVYKGMYVSDDQISPAQLQAIARGELPWPQVVYLPESDFKGTPDEIMELVSRRASSRSSSEPLRSMFGTGMSEIDDPTGETKALGFGRTHGKGDFGENDPLMVQYPSRQGDPQQEHTHAHRG